MSSRQCGKGAPHTQHRAVLAAPCDRVWLSRSAVRLVPAPLHVPTTAALAHAPSAPDTHAQAAGADAAAEVGAHAAQRRRVPRPKVQKVSVQLDAPGQELKQYSAKSIINSNWWVCMHTRQPAGSAMAEQPEAEALGSRLATAWQALHSIYPCQTHINCTKLYDDSRHVSLEAVCLGATAAALARVAKCGFLAVVAARELQTLCLGQKGRAKRRWCGNPR